MRINFELFQYQRNSFPTNHPFRSNSFHDNRILPISICRVKRQFSRGVFTDVNNRFPINCRTLIITIIPTHGINLIFRYVKLVRDLVSHDFKRQYIRPSQIFRSPTRFHRDNQYPVSPPISKENFALHLIQHRNITQRPRRN